MKSINLTIGLKNLQQLIAQNDIFIISGEGENGNLSIYDGKRTIRAIKMRLTKERCSGDRWAKAKVFSHINDFGRVFVDCDTGKYIS